MTFTEWLNQKYKLKTIQDFYDLPVTTQEDLEEEYEEQNHDVGTAVHECAHTFCNIAEDLGLKG